MWEDSGSEPTSPLAHPVYREVVSDAARAAPRDQEFNLFGFSMPRELRVNRGVALMPDIVALHIAAAHLADAEGSRLDTIRASTNPFSLSTIHVSRATQDVPNGTEDAHGAS